MPLNIVLATSVLGLLLAFWRMRLRSKTSSYRTLPLPPGPKPLPLIGNTFHVPKSTEHPWRTYAKWAQTHGDVVHIQVLRKHLIVIHSLDGVHDLFDRRSSIYSDREITETIKLTGWDWNLGMMNYGQEWRAHRRLFYQYMNEQIVHTYDAHVRNGTRHLLKLLHRDPKAYVRHLRYAIAEVVLSMTYGIKVESGDDSYVKMLEAAMESAEDALLPGSFWVDFMPVLKYVPSWVPGAGWQKKFAAWREETNAVRNVPWDNVVDDGPVPSIASQMLDQLSHLDTDARTRMVQTVQKVCAVVYAGAADTISSTLQTFILAMVLYPEAQGLAQAELSNVVGHRRLPDFSDLSALPYTGALLKECMRWQPVGPLGVPHRCTADNEYRGWLIPKGAVVFQNIWSILHDPETFPDPEKFDPGRYLQDGVPNPDVPDPAAVVFGAGRRVCPGRHFANTVLLLSVTRILHAFDITPVLNTDGSPINPKVEMTSGFVTHPVPFACDIKARGSWAEALIVG
ncbi:hypothetical protein CERSUDRAFT_114152 [Gelatoporia subvermispora B]|uniref:Cytochrome P450 n=1 Tax=Ceriporiopsis subvermispora (strain B) TaxID=914234 RepID=M2RFD0_CERS8|nr:hypothetical protein CERSUDRAFT_114152 [Gelatoporia subvermispora B]